MASIHPTATIASTAVLCGEVQVSAGAVIRDGAILAADGGTIRIGENTIVMEHAVIRSTAADDCTLGAHVMVGPHTHLTGCTVEDEVFIATGASVFNGATLKKWSEVRINGVVHIDTSLEEGTTVPIGWVAVGSPPQIFPPERHDDIWAIQKNLNFPTRVFGEPRSSEDGVSLMRRMIGKYAAALRKRLGRNNT
ncbi:MAG: gamma carbonic anhydrase family protein [Rhodoferax sp.]|nr:gamma carbonic anhydrase family protein [Rhodoferax sp.]